jgi:hypothetical protein
VCKEHVADIHVLAQVELAAGVETRELREQVPPVQVRVRLDEDEQLRVRAMSKRAVHHRKELDMKNARIKLPTRTHSILCRIRSDARRVS